MRQNAIKMSKNFNTPVFDWINLPLAEFTRWIRAGNAVIKAEDDAIQEARKRKR